MKCEKRNDQHACDKEKNQSPRQELNPRPRAGALFTELRELKESTG